MVDFGAIKERQQQAWATGDYHMIGTAVACEAGDLRSTPKVLDVATGSGNTTLAAARRWCESTGINYVPSLLERRRVRANAECLNVTFSEGEDGRPGIPFPGYNGPVGK